MVRRHFFTFRIHRRLSWVEPRDKKNRRIADPDPFLGPQHIDQLMWDIFSMGCVSDKDYAAATRELTGRGLPIPLCPETAQERSGATAASTSTGGPTPAGKAKTVVRSEVHKVTPQPQPDVRPKTGTRSGSKPTPRSGDRPSTGSSGRQRSRDRRERETAGMTHLIHLFVRIF